MYSAFPQGFGQPSFFLEYVNKALYFPVLPSLFVQLRKICFGGERAAWLQARGSTGVCSNSTNSCLKRDNYKKGGSSRSSRFSLPQSPPFLGLPLPRRWHLAFPSPDLFFCFPSPSLYKPLSALKLLKWVFEDKKSPHLPKMSALK